jgi:phosphoribosyl-ATP pyrophosphohydrolase/phosphoribosyl-ATP pyrophosphatase
MLGNHNHIDPNSKVYSFLLTLEEIIQAKLDSPTTGSYVGQLGSQGTARVAQKVGEEAAETIIEAVKANFDESQFLAEAADLLFHYLILLHQKGYSLKQVVQVLETRHQIAKNK